MEKIGEFDDNDDLGRIEKECSLLNFVIERITVIYKFKITLWGRSLMTFTVL